MVQDDRYRARDDGVMNIKTSDSKAPAGQNVPRLQATHVELPAAPYVVATQLDKHVE